MVEQVQNSGGDTFDYVIVGSGAAGSILCHRLTEDAGVTVCVLECGPPDRHPYIHIPAGFIKMLFNPGYTWQFQTEPGEGINGRRIPTTQGRTLGGSTSINGMIWFAKPLYGLKPYHGFESHPLRHPVARRAALCWWPLEVAAVKANEDEATLNRRGRVVVRLRARCKRAGRSCRTSGQGRARARQSRRRLQQYCLCTFCIPLDL